MKAVLYSLIAIILLGILAPAVKARKDDPRHIFLRSETALSQGELENSAKIIGKRLSLYFESPVTKAAIVTGKQVIDVVFPSSADQNVIEDLVTHEGAISFYEVYDHREMVDLLEGNNTIFAIMKTDSTDNKSGRLGCVQIGEKDRIDSLLKTIDTGNKCRFMWTQNPESMKTCLLPLKTGNNNPVIKGKDIGSSGFRDNRIYIKLKDTAAESWAETTRRDIGKTIAIVLDDNVLSYPVVRAAIEGGEIEISGRFSDGFGRYVSSMINGGVLPATFQVVK